MATHDPLTDLPNRAFFQDFLNTSISQAHRFHFQVAVLFLDLDDFKIINDTHGHETGDLYLIALARRLGNTVRASDLVARQGGDEFTLILQYIKQKDHVIKIAQKIMDALAEPIIIHENEFITKASIGIALYPDDADTAEDLINLADQAMYKSKTSGKGQFQFYSEL